MKPFFNHPLGKKDIFDNINLGEFLRDKMYKSIPGLAKPTEEQKEGYLKKFEEVAGGALQSN